MEFYEFKEGCIVATGEVDEDGIPDYEEYEISSITAWFNSETQCTGVTINSALNELDSANEDAENELRDKLTAEELDGNGDEFEINAKKYIRELVDATTQELDDDDIEIICEGEQS